MLELTVRDVSSFFAFDVITLSYNHCTKKIKHYQISQNIIEILLLIAYALNPPLNAHADVIRDASGFKFWHESACTPILCVCEQRKLWQVCADSLQLSLLENVIRVSTHYTNVLMSLPSNVIDVREIRYLAIRMNSVLLFFDHGGS